MILKVGKKIYINNKFMKKKERQNIINTIQLTIGISISAACAIAILILGLFFLGSKLGI